MLLGGRNRKSGVLKERRIQYICCGSGPSLTASIVLCFFSL
jgi:hypothetical protein